MKQKIKQYQDPFLEIEKILSEIHNCLIPVAQNFEKYDRNIIELPPYISLWVYMEFSKVKLPLIIE